MQSLQLLGILSFNKYEKYGGSGNLVRTLVTWNWTYKARGIRW